MPWALLIISGFLECAWAIGLKQTEGFTRLWPSILTLVALVSSVGLLSWAARDLPIGTAYAVWVGVGAIGTAALGIVVFNEPVGPGRLLCLAALSASLIGLKLTS